MKKTAQFSERPVAEIPKKEGPPQWAALVEQLFTLCKLQFGFKFRQGEEDRGWFAGG